MELREHQAAAVAAIIGAQAAGERRMTVVSACGTGKTLVAAAAAQALAEEGSVLVVMPTLALVVQTIRRWREAGRLGKALGVCSLTQQDSGLSTDEAVMTSCPRTIAHVGQGNGPFTVFSTYDSVTDIIRSAHDSFDLPPWDLVIVDEAHRTCSAYGDGWGTIHDDAAIPAKTRVYMTATPRLWGSPALGDGPAPSMERIPLATMDIHEIFGPTVYRLTMSEAIELGILADYQVILPIVDESDADLHDILAAPYDGVAAHENGVRTGALHVAIIRAIAEYRLRRVLVFFNRIRFAEAFAETFPQTALEVDEPLRLEGLWARAIHSGQSGEERQHLLEDFADPDRSCAVLSNVRVLNEGVDMPDVDAVVFAEPRYSTIDGVQAIGRGLRQPPGAGKKTTLVIPVYLRSDLNPADLYKTSGFQMLLALLEALRAHDESFMDRIALPDTRARTMSLQTQRLLYAHPERAAQLARALGLQIAVPAIGSWEEALTHATAYRTRYGHLDVPDSYINDDRFDLGGCMRNFRLRHMLGSLPDKQFQALDALGMRWTVGKATFESMLGHVRTWADQNGHLMMPGKEEVGGHKLGSWIAAQRKRAAAGRLPAEHQQALEAIDPYWNPPWPRDWQRKYVRAKAMSPGPERWRPSASAQFSRSDSTTAEWVDRQQLNYYRLHREQRQLLQAIGIAPRPGGAEYGGTKHAPAAAPPTGGTKPPAPKSKIDLALEDAAAYVKRNGDLKVPRKHYEPRWWADTSKTPPLAWWIQRFRTEPHTLNAEQRRAWETILKKAKRSESPEPPPAA